MAPVAPVGVPPKRVTLQPLRVVRLTFREIPLVLTMRRSRRRSCRTARTFHHHNFHHQTTDAGPRRKIPASITSVSCLLILRKSSILALFNRNGVAGFYNLLTLYFFRALGQGSWHLQWGRPKLCDPRFTPQPLTIKVGVRILIRCVGDFESGRRYTENVTERPGALRAFYPLARYYPPVENLTDSFEYLAAPPFTFSCLVWNGR